MNKKSFTLMAEGKKFNSYYNFARICGKKDCDGMNWVGT